jgi:hypothetical protein
MDRGFIILENALAWPGMKPMKHHKLAKNALSEDLNIHQEMILVSYVHRIARHCTPDRSNVNAMKDITELLPFHENQLALVLHQHQETLLIDSLMKLP